MKANEGCCRSTDVKIKSKRGVKLDDWSYFTADFEEAENVEACIIVGLPSSGSYKIGDLSTVVRAHFDIVCRFPTSRSPTSCSVFRRCIRSS